MHGDNLRTTKNLFCEKNWEIENRNHKDGGIFNFGRGEKPKISLLLASIDEGSANFDFGFELPPTVGK